MRYLISYTSGATGFGWERESNCIKEVRMFLEEIRYNNSAMIIVVDKNKKGDERFIFYKDFMSSPKVDHIFNLRSDLRTKNNLKKY